MRKRKLPLFRIAIYTVLLTVVAVTVPPRVQEWVADDRRFEPLLTFDEVKRTEFPDAPHQRYLILYHERGDIPEVLATVDNLSMALRYAKLPYDVMSFAEYKKLNTPLARYQQGAVVIVGERQEELPHQDLLQKYVTEQGGLLINALRSPRSPLNPFFGIEGTPKFAVQPPIGLHWAETNIYPGLSEVTLSGDKLTSSSLTLQPALEDDAVVWAESDDEGSVPYLWVIERGAGKVIYWNTTALQETPMRGAFIQTMLKAQGGAKASVGAQVWFIDDFPSPAYGLVSPGNTTGMSDYMFRLKRWDPDMQEIAKKYGIRYSAGVIFMYNDQVKGPFEYVENGQENLFDLEVELVKSGGELGLHGYNHLSLRKSYTDYEKQLYGYKPWPSEQEMLAALLTARKLWQQEIKAPLPTMYIPPSNVLSREGKMQLYNAFPELKTISALYATPGKGGEFSQEFLADPDIPQIMGTPRVTYGYSLTDDEKFDLYSAIANLGIVSHFNHPDDVFHGDRNKGKTWLELRDDYAKLVGDVNSRFQWLQPLTATELSDKLRMYHATQVQFDRSEQDRLTAYLSPLQGPMVLEVHVNDPFAWQAVSGGEILARNEEYGLLWVEATEPKLVLEVAK
ncbi:hypothetical protein EV586_101547 [Tumebacillus sp. BK434]|uniref:DUF2194 domain-containing protein n=1 Tax=Tumebacillus sp. BK434 TaxID=2512169 RepID=UPI001053EB04|nr:DUF2194 domain-containing protein [Tumebacillus sp. BK434]TCP59331.1 hypothetical protein EV586_101547 [Tumebacillus sp. BK434]